jgi:signal transduction histidine kinase
MQEQAQIAEGRKIDAREIYSQLRQIEVFSQLREEDAGCLGEVEIVEAPAGSVLYRNGETISGFWGIVSGEIRGYKKEADGVEEFFLHATTGDSFGEVPLLTGKTTFVASCTVVKDAILIGIDNQGFWRMMSACPVVRQAIIENTQRRILNYQAFAVHKEKLISLGTLSAGLMHELNNPGTAAKRSAAQLRENLIRLQQISLRFCELPWDVNQMECMKELQRRVLTGEAPESMNTIDQSDAEESLAEWLDELGVENSWKMAPTLTAIGLTSRDLECTHEAFPGGTFSDTLNWLDSLISSMQLVTTIEESITRISELVGAVKKYAYNEAKGQLHAVDIHDGLKSTITILAHKLRPKDLKIDKQFAAELPVVKSHGAGLTQVWTNLLDNAIDASPDGGTIHIRTWIEDGQVCVGIADEGTGIAEKNKQCIFKAFFTTKPVGVGTGLGLDIAHRIVVGSYRGEINFTSVPGKTEFVVRIPLAE